MVILQISFPAIRRHILSLMNRGLLKRWILVVPIILAALLAIYTTRIAPRWLRISKLRVGIPALPPEWDGLRISHLSDFHLGSSGMTTDHLHLARQQALDFNPDLIALTGDYYEAGTEVPSEGLFRDWPEGVPVLAVMGNHDRRGKHSLERTIRELQAGGATVLNNEAIPITFRGRQAWICGVDDAHTFNIDVQKALADIPDGEPALLMLSHSPAAILDVEPGDVSLIVAGHTHGGQVRLVPSGAIPFVKQIRKARGLAQRPDGPVYRRWHWINGTILLISDGLGVSTLPVRFRTRPHLLLIELHRAEPISGERCDNVSRYVEDISEESWLSKKLT